MARASLREGRGFKFERYYGIFLISGSSSVWLERCVRDAEVASSNLVSPILVSSATSETCVFFSVVSLLLKL